MYHHRNDREPYQSSKVNTAARRKSTSLRQSYTLVVGGRIKCLEKMWVQITSFTFFVDMPAWDFIDWVTLHYIAGIFFKIEHAIYSYFIFIKLLNNAYQYRALIENAEQFYAMQNNVIKWERAERSEYSKTSNKKFWEEHYWAIPNSSLIMFSK